MRIDELREIGVSQAVLEKLADADAFNSMGLDRREAFGRFLRVMTGRLHCSRDSQPRIHPSLLLFCRR